ncbi:hypothetical protein MASR2M41_20440 [Flammeovirgaceae bacterium]
MKILCIGEEWKGSNASGLFYALSRIGFVTNVVNELSYISTQAKTFSAKGINKISRSIQVNDFNAQLCSITQSFQPDLILVYKGAYISRDTIQFWKQRNLPVVNFFPDVSFMAHGKYIPDCIRLYDHIFTTKSFGAQDLKKNFGISSEKISFLPHGFDPTVHLPKQQDVSFQCDASFIGNYSLRKESYLKKLKEDMPEIDLRIWGSTWRRNDNDPLSTAIQSFAVLGDSYALAISNSKINVALLSERVSGASSGDQITSRTFHIPAAGGFMLHQRTEELKQYFEEGEEIACFESEAELVEKTAYYLSRESERERIRVNGYQRAIAEHSMDARAQSFVQILRVKHII